MIYFLFFLSLSANILFSYTLFKVWKEKKMKYNLDRISYENELKESWNVLINQLKIGRLTVNNRTYHLIKGEEMKNNSEITNENFRQIGNKLVESLLYPDATKIELFSYLKEKTMNNQDIRDLILDLEETIQECKRIVKKSSYGNEIIKLEGEISAYKDCIVRLQEYYK